jgi:hypothetical protein
MERSEVKRVFDSLHSSDDDDQNTLDGIVRILTGWHTDSDFTGPYGVPLELKLEESGGPDFSELCERYFSDIKPKNLQEELLRLGIITETEKGWFRILKRTYAPEGGAPDGLEHLARTFQDIVNTLDHNYLEDEPSKKLFERHVYTEDGIREEDLPRFRAFAYKRAQILLEEIDNWLTQLEKPDPATKQNLSTGLGIFHYIHRDDQDI